MQCCAKFSALSPQSERLEQVSDLKERNLAMVIKACLN